MPIHTHIWFDIKWAINKTFAFGLQQLLWIKCNNLALLDTRQLTWCCRKHGSFKCHYHMTIHLLDYDYRQILICCFVGPTWEQIPLALIYVNTETAVSSTLLGIPEVPISHLVPECYIRSENCEFFYITNASQRLHTEQRMLYIWQTICFYIFYVSREH
jgi:hypothetical protein